MRDHGIYLISRLVKCGFTQSDAADNRWDELEDYSEIVANVDSAGLKAANKFTIRIPENADFGGKIYVSPLEYAETEDASNLFTLKNGDIVVRGAVTVSGVKPADLHKLYEAFTVLGVTDNRRAPNAPHWKVVGA